MMQIPENALLNEIISKLRGRESFKDADITNDERIYHGDIFECMLNEDAQFSNDDVAYANTYKLYYKMSKKAISQLEELSKLVDTDYVQITII